MIRRFSRATSGRATSKGLLRDDRGAAFTEYIILVGCIAIATLTAWRAFGQSIVGIVHKQADEVARLDEGGGRCIGGLCLNGACFAAGTLVATPSGLRPIEQIVAGDPVLSRREATSEVVVEPVLRTVATRDERLVEVRLSRRDPIRSTPGHLFWTTDRGWVPARTLEPGEELYASGGAELRVAGVEPLAATATVYNLEVEGTHTYFVGRDGAWVHNPTGPCGASGEGGGGSTGEGVGAGGSSGGPGVRGGAPDGTFVTGAGYVLTGAQALQAASLRAGVQSQVAGLPKSDVVVAGVLDTKTGQIYYGVNSGDLPAPLNPALAPYVASVQADPQHGSDPGIHAEIQALNTALNARQQATGQPIAQSDLKTFMLDTAWLTGSSRQPGGMKRGEPALLCGNCQATVPPGVVVLPGSALPNSPPR